MLNNEAYFAGLREQQQRLSADTLMLRQRYGLNLAIQADLDRDEFYLRDDMNLGEGERLPFSLEEQAAIARVIAQEISKYPPQFLIYTRIETVRVIRGLRGDGAQGVALDHPGYPIVASTRDGLDELKGTIHHELFHQSDLAFNDVVPQKKYDEEWIYLASAGFRPDFTTGTNQSVLAKSSIDSEQEGLDITPEEDRAELAEDIMVKSNWVGTKFTDPSWGPQLFRMMGAYQARSRNLMDFAYFQDLFNGKVGENYWMQRGV